MEILDIKQNLTLQQVLNHYNLQPKNNMLRCPFHEDSTASLQVSFSQNKYKCHACDKKGDVIQFVQDYEKLTKHEALKKCTAMIETIQPVRKATTTIQTTNPVNEQERILFLEKMYLSFRKGLLSSPQAKEYSPTARIYHRNASADLQSVPTK
jgi:DNA primase